MGTLPSEPLAMGVAVQRHNGGFQMRSLRPISRFATLVSWSDRDLESQAREGPKVPRNGAAAGFVFAYTPVAATS
jgi:hypothetical protein